MRFLADSPVIYWAMTRPEELIPSAQEKLVDPENEIFVSAASIWELQIKARKGKLLLPEGFTSALTEEHFTPLPITWKHAEFTSTLPLLRGDPIDRLLVAQTLVEGLVLMTRDEAIREHEVPLCRA